MIVPLILCTMLGIIVGSIVGALVHFSKKVNKKEE